MQFPSSFLSSRLVSVHVVHPYSSIDSTAAWKKLRFILLVRSDFHMIYIYIYIYIYKYIYISSSSYIHTHTSTHKHHTSTHIHPHTYIHKHHTSTHIHPHTNTRMKKMEYILTFTYTQTQTDTHTHTHTHTCVCARVCGFFMIYENSAIARYISLEFYVYHTIVRRKELKF